MVTIKDIAALACRSDLYYQDEYSRKVYRVVRVEENFDQFEDGVTEPVAWLDNGKCVALDSCYEHEFVRLRGAYD